MFHQGFQTPRNNKSTRPTAYGLITFSVFGIPDETLALVFDILHEKLRCRNKGKEEKEKVGIIGKFCLNHDSK